jgi:TrmH RNA methyltransferase
MKPNVICGVPAVAALFARRPADAMRLFYLEDLRASVGPWCAVLAAARKPYRMVPAEQVTKVAGTPHHGGIALVAKPRIPSPFDPANPPATRLLVALDGIGNPHNLGAIARGAAFFGAGALLIGEGGALPSDAAYRTAEGGLDYLDVIPTADLPAALRALSTRFLTVAASLDPSAGRVADIPRDRPVALVLGNEERGLAPNVLAACQRQVRIVGAGKVQSLNVAQAAAVLLHALAP